MKLEKVGETQVTLETLYDFSHLDEADQKYLVEWFAREKPELVGMIVCGGCKEKEEYQKYCLNKGEKK